MTIAIEAGTGVEIDMTIETATGGETIGTEETAIGTIDAMIVIVMIEGTTEGTIEESQHPTMRSSLC